MIRITWLACALPLALAAQNAAPAETPVQMVVTVGHAYGPAPGLLTRDDFLITQQAEPVRVTNVIPVRGEHAGIELFLLVDHCSNCEPGSKFEELRRFILAQPAATSIGVAYIRNGKIEMGQPLTRDHELAVKALSTPEGSKPASPFDALKQLIDTWPVNSNRHVVLMVSNGVDPAAPEALQDPSAEAAIEAAERAGVSLYAIYHPSADYTTADFSKIYSGQVQLAHVATETGGESYFLGFGPLPSLAPFLADIADHLAQQYVVEFLAKPVTGPGAFEDVTVKCRIPNIELMAPDKVWVPGVPASNARTTGGQRP